MAKRSRRKKNNLTEIARHLNISIATVSRVLNNSPNVKWETRKRVLEYLQKTGYFDDYPTRDNHIGLVRNNKLTLENRYFSTFLGMIDEAVTETGNHLTLLNWNRIEEEIQEYGHSTVLNDMSGILWLGPYFNKKYAALLNKSNINYVLINTEPVLKSDIACISENRIAAEKAVRYFQNKGHSRIGFIAGYTDQINSRDRLEGYSVGMGDTLNPDHIINDLDYCLSEKLQEKLMDLLQKKDSPTAFLVSTDFFIQRVYHCIEKCGLKIPENISLISFDNYPIAESINPPLSSYQPDTRGIVDHSLNLLMKIINNQPLKIESPRFFQQTLIIRESVSTLN